MPFTTSGLILPLFRGISRFESLILSHHPSFTREYNKEEINDVMMMAGAPTLESAAWSEREGERARARGRERECERQRD